MTLTDELRRELIASGAMVGDLQRVVDEGGPTWDTAQLQQDFTVEGFAAPFVVVRRKSDGARGTLAFTHRPRVYFDFVEDK